MLEEARISAEADMRCGRALSDAGAEVAVFGFGRNLEPSTSDDICSGKDGSRDSDEVSADPHVGLADSTSNVKLEEELKDRTSL